MKFISLQVLPPSVMEALQYHPFFVTWAAAVADVHRLAFMASLSRHRRRPLVRFAVTAISDLLIGRANDHA